VRSLPPFPFRYRLSLLLRDIRSHFFVCLGMIHRTSKTISMRAR
jgi:hypothetical protein